MKRKIIIGIVLVLIFSAASGVIYLNNTYLPIKVKNRLARSLETFLNYNVEIERLRYSPVRGVIIQNLSVYDKVKDKENTILTIKEASFHVLFLPLIKERKVIIPIIHIDSPYLNIRYQQDNNLNFSRIFQPKAGPKKKPGIKFSFLVYKINIFDGKGIFQDERLTPEFTKTIQDLDIVLGIRQLTKVAFLIDCKALTEKGEISGLSFQGNYNFLSKEFNSKLNLANLVITEFNPYLKALPLSISSGTIDNSALDFNFKNNLMALKGTISTKGLGLRKENLALIGDIIIEPDLTYTLDKKAFEYKANVKFIQTELDGIKYLQKISNASGDVGITKDKIWTDNMRLQALDSGFTLKGALDILTNPHLKLDFKSEELNLEKLLPVLPFKPEGINLKGAAAAEINIEGYLGNLPLDAKAALQLNNAKLEALSLKGPVDAIKGKVDVSKDNINWSGLTFNYLNTDYTSNGKLVNFQEPQITFGLTSKDLDLRTDVKIKDKLVRVITFAGKYMNSLFETEGSIDMQDNINPLFDLTLNLNLTPSDTFGFLSPSLSETLKKIKPDGILNIKGALNGKIKDYRNWNVALKASADNFSAYNLKLNNLSFNLEEKHGTLNLSKFTSSFYSGILILDFISDLKPEVPNYYLKVNGAEIDLAKLKLDTESKDKDISGMLNISAELSGTFKDLSALRGNGSLSVKEGRLWQLSLFKGLAELFLLPDYEKIAFREALGDFNIEDKSVHTENLRLISDQLNLDCRGKLGFDGALDFTVYTEANKNFIRDSADLRKFTSAILGDLSAALTVKVSGTIQKPKYKIIPVAAELIKNIKDFFLGK